MPATGCLEQVGPFLRLAAVVAQPPVGLFPLKGAPGGNNPFTDNDAVNQG
jgi:hypothetical protein